MTTAVDVAVIGAGFGGLSAALHLAEAGRSVVLLEALRYPGGCASTFERGGVRHEAGATIFAGLGPGQWMRCWIDRFGLDVQVTSLDPVAELRADGLALPVGASRDALVERLCALPDAPAAGVRSFFAELKAAADALWPLFDAPELLPPLEAAALGAHLRRLPAYLPLLRLVGRSLDRVLARHGVQHFAPLRLWLDAACQITIQTRAAEAEAPFALAAVDYFFRGAAHVDGGVGRLADEVVAAIRRLGGEVRLADRVRSLTREGERWRVEARSGALQARHVVANLLPQDVDRLIGRAPRGLLTRRVHQSWGAAALYLQLADRDLPSGPLHLQLIDDAALALVSGNHALLSIAERDPSRAPAGHRTATLSTHTAILDDADAMAAHTQRVQDRLRRTLARRAPELRVLDALPASPRTFARFTRRGGGRVGGIPRRVGLQHYLQLGPVQHAPDVYLVGDSVFPGQSVLAVSVGGHRVASAILRR